MSLGVALSCRLILKGDLDTMKIFREEASGGVIFDTESLQYKISEDRTLCETIIPLVTHPPRTDILSAPVRVYFEVTQKCNLKCSHCFVSASPKGYYGLDSQSIFQLLDELHRLRVLEIRFTGGEPTIRNDWFDVLSYAKQKGFAVTLNTNGVFAKSKLKQTIERLQTLGLQQITVSVDGMQNVHDSIRGSGNFERVNLSLKAMATAGLPLRINSVINQKNLADIPALIDLAAQYAKEINFFYMRTIGRAASETHNNLAFDEHFRSALEAYKIGEMYPHLRVTHSAGSQLGLAIGTPYRNTTFSIAADGSFWPDSYSSHQSQKLRLGSFPQDSIEHIWFYSPKLNRLRNWFSMLLTRCGACVEYKKNCPGVNFEMEIAKVLGNGNRNPYCISSQPTPDLSEL